MRRTLFLFVAAVLAAACSGGSEIGDIPPLPETSAAEVRQLIEDAERPLVLNVWASWCLPCRSEAPLLRAAHEAFAGEVLFVGLNVRDNQDSARSFIHEFGLGGFTHLFDPSGAAQGSLQARGVPATLFIAPGGDLIELHYGVIDERSLALNIDEILRRSG